MASCFKRSRLIHIKYYFFTDQIRMNKMSIEHCPTNSMVADFFPKPLQGSAFYEFRKAIMDSLNRSTIKIPT
jgi:hypothetical protein